MQGATGLLSWRVAGHRRRESCAQLRARTFHRVQKEGKEAEGQFPRGADQEVTALVGIDKLPCDATQRGAEVVGEPTTTTVRTARPDTTRRISSWLSGRRDLNPRRSPWQGEHRRRDSNELADLERVKGPERTRKDLKGPAGLPHCYLMWEAITSCCRRTSMAGRPGDRSGTSDRPRPQPRNSTGWTVS